MSGDRHGVLFVHDVNSTQSCRHADLVDAATEVVVDGERSLAPDIACEDCAQHGHCHIKLTPAAVTVPLELIWARGKFAIGPPALLKDAPAARDPEPERA